MRIADAVGVTIGVEAVRATAGALFGWPGDLFSADGETFSATLTIDDDARVPGLAALLRPGAEHRAVVQVGPDRRDTAVRKLCVKIPDAYGPGRDQDFLMASSGDGAPLHHAALPTDSVASRYSSLWLYLAGLQPVLFGAVHLHDRARPTVLSGRRTELCDQPPARAVPEDRRPHVDGTARRRGPLRRPQLRGQHLAAAPGQLLLSACP